jgi:hypothetical protein
MPEMLTRLYRNSSKNGCVAPSRGRTRFVGEYESIRATKSMESGGVPDRNTCKTRTIRLA